jgi:ABC-type amino acid transport substrate-binding protein
MASVPIWERRKDLSGRLLRVGFDYYFPPFSHTVDGLPAGFFGELLLALASPHMLNFSYALMKSVDGLYGSVTEDGRSFDGLLGMAQRNEIDLVASELSISDMRARVVDFITPVWTTTHK